MLALGPFPRFAANTVKNIEKSWTMVVDGFSIEDAGGNDLCVDDVMRLVVWLVAFGWLFCFDLVWLIG